MNNLLIDVTISDEYKSVELKDLYWIAPLIILVLLLSIGVTLFYYSNPIQLLWLIPFTMLALI